jgi:hypothetical protein
MNLLNNHTNIDWGIDIFASLDRVKTDQPRQLATKNVSAIWTIHVWEASSTEDHL